MQHDDPLTMYVQELATVASLSGQEEADLFQRASTPGAEGEVAKRRLIESKLHLVLPIAERHSSSGLSMLDLIQEGNVGLMRAVDKFPNTQLGDFSACATACIEDTILNAIAKKSKSKR